jgi:hypothetical protein
VNLMGSYAKAKGRSENGGYIMLIHPLFDSLAYRSLSSRSRDVLMLLLRRYNGLNNGEISLSCREVESYFNMSKSTASRSFKELQLHGFIQPMKLGVFTLRYATTWRLTFQRTVGDYGKSVLATNEWKRFDPDKKKVPGLELRVSHMEL